MALKDDLSREVGGIVGQVWRERNGQVVPTDQSITLANDAVQLEATVLYADLSDSTKLVDGYQPWFAAEIYKAFLRCASRIIRANNGQIIAFDGDRVMAIFIGNSKNTTAALVGLQINWCCKNIIQPAINARYPQSGYIIRHTVGIDTSLLFAAKAGIRGSNDLVWIGRAANYAAKLCEESHDYPTWITAAVYDQLGSKALAWQGNNMWKGWNWNRMGGQQVYSSNWTWVV